jgi:hypothetical protein
MPAPLSEYHDFFGASVGAAAALIGLLFVAVSIAPERTFGESADRLRRADAERAFAALGNIFFVSLAAVLPHSSLQSIAVIAALTLIQVARLAFIAWRTRGDTYPWTQLGLISVVIYAFQLSLAVRMLLGGDIHDGLIWVVFGLYSYALGTSWGLLGAERKSLR